MGKFKIGDRVKYISGQWMEGNDNPLWGGMCGYIVGTITELKLEDNALRVQWDNGSSNNYYESDLDIVKEQPVVKVKTRDWLGMKVRIRE